MYFFIHTSLTYVGNLFPPITTLIIIWYIQSTTKMSLSTSYFLASITSLLFYPGRTLVTGINNWNSVKVAMRRYNKFLSLEEKSLNIQNDDTEFGTLQLKNLTGSWIN